jgi:hypothetical protein
LRRALRAAIGLFLLAFAVRVAYLRAADDPLLSTEYSYFQGGLAIADDPHPLRAILTSDAWRAWGGHWTVAPLYYVFLAAVFATGARAVAPVLVIQCALDAATAVAVAALGRRLSPRFGSWAGVTYAVFWPSVVMTSRVLSENLHTPLLVAGILLLTIEGDRARDPEPKGRSAGAAGAFVVGLSALARAVSFAFLPVAALWRWAIGGPGRTRAALVLLGSGMLAIVPWWARNAFVIGDPVPIETLAYYNLYLHNSFVGKERVTRRAHYIAREPTPKARRALAVRYALEGWTEHPLDGLAKVARNVRHFLRAEGVYQWLGAEVPRSLGWHLGNVLLGDLVFAPALFLFTVFLVAGPPIPGRFLLGLWMLYYLFLVIVVFNAEVRYRTGLAPFVLAGAPAGFEALRTAEPRWRRVAVVLGLLVAVVPTLPFTVPLLRAAQSAWTLRPAREAIDHGDLAGARMIADRAAALNPTAVRPWLTFARWMDDTGHSEEAVAAYREALARRPPHWVARVALPTVLADAGRTDEAAEARAAAEAFLDAEGINPGVALEGAWVFMAPPRTDEIRMGVNDYGAARNFLHDRGTFRWTRHRASLRLVPATVAPRYEVTLEMASPPPAPTPNPEVDVRGPGRAHARFRLSADVRPYSFFVPAPPLGTPLRVDIEAPSWNEVDQPPDQGVRVDRMTVAPVGK